MALIRLLRCLPPLWGRRHFLRLAQAALNCLKSAGQIQTYLLLLLLLLLVMLLLLLLSVLLLQYIAAVAAAARIVAVAGVS